MHPKDAAQAYILIDFLTRNKEEVGYEKDVYLEATTEETALGE